MKSLKLKKARNAKFRGMVQHRHCKSHAAEQGENIEVLEVRNKDITKKRLLEKIAQDNLYEFSEFSGQNEFYQNRSQQLQRKGYSNNNTRESRICPWNSFNQQQQNFKWDKRLLITPSISKGQLKAKNGKMFTKVRIGSLLTKQNSKTMQLAKREQNVPQQNKKCTSNPTDKEGFAVNEIKGYKTMYMKEENDNNSNKNINDQQSQKHYQRQILKNISTMVNNIPNNLNNENNIHNVNNTSIVSTMTNNNCNKLKFFIGQQYQQSQQQSPFQNKLLFGRIMDKTFHIKENCEDVNMVPILTFGDERMNSLNISRSSSSYNKKVRGKGYSNKENRIIKLPTSIVLTDNSNESSLGKQKLKYLNQLIINDEKTVKREAPNKRGCIFYPSNNPFIRSNFQNRIEMRNIIINENSGFYNK